MNSTSFAADRCGGMETGWKTAPLTWFITGFCASWAAWWLITFSGETPHRRIPSVIRVVASDWTERARVRPLGPLAVIAPDNSMEASAIIYPSEPPHFPIGVFRDKNSDGRLGMVHVFDIGGRSFRVFDDDKDGRFDWYSYSTGGSIDSLTFADADMDGEYEHRVGPGRSLSVKMGSQWHAVTVTDGKHYIELGGEVTEVAYVDGDWRTAVRE